MAQDEDSGMASAVRTEVDLGILLVRHSRTLRAWAARSYPTYWSELLVTGTGSGTGPLVPGTGSPAPVLLLSSEAKPNMQLDALARHQHQGRIYELHTNVLMVYECEAWSWSFAAGAHVTRLPCPVSQLARQGDQSQPSGLCALALLVLCCQLPMRARPVCTVEESSAASLDASLEAQEPNIHGSLRSARRLPVSTWPARRGVLRSHGLLMHQHVLCLRALTQPSRHAAESACSSTYSLDEYPKRSTSFSSSSTYRCDSTASPLT